ncbi:MAG: hypothetical protein J5772_08680 [Clostridia bacterium]|nr:hypothetical protein [Clostridia bacterium]
MSTDKKWKKGGEHVQRKQLKPFRRAVKGSAAERNEQRSDNEHYNKSGISHVAGYAGL